MVCILHGYYDAQPKMRFSLTPPPSKVSITSPTSTTTSNNNNSTTYCKSLSRSRNNNNMLSSSTVDGTDDAASDYNQWLHAMKLVARLPGGTPPEFRRKLWLSLADKYLKSKNVDWTEQREKCFCEEWREDDEELGIQIVKDLHRTGSNLCTGPAGSINQAKLKRILLGYARYNPEVGYCQGFNMLGALILQVMDKEEEESMKVMIYLVEGVLPTGYFYGSMGGLQADMGVFRELMQTKLPRLAKHLQRLQGPVENAYEPPLTNVFTMQWFLTMFCTCLPMSCVLRVWDLVLIEGSDVLLRTALVLWSLLEERVLNARTADDFYGKMGSFSNELLNGHLIDSNGLIEKVVQLGPIADIKQLRDKHLYNIAPLGNKQGLQLYYDDEDTHSDEESRLAVATVFGLNWGRRGSVGTGPLATGKPQAEQKDRLALDISVLKKQYDRLRERQKQAHVILTTACSTATSTRQTPSSNLPVNQLLLGRPAIVTNKGKRVSPPVGAIPPARKPSLPAVLHSKPAAERQLRRGETLHWRDTDATRNRRDSLTWKEIKADRAALLREGSEMNQLKTQKLRARLGKSDSSSYSEESDGDQEVGGKDGSSSDTSLCDDDDPKSMEQSPKRKAKLARKLKENPKLAAKRVFNLERRRPKSWAPSSHEIPFILMGADSGDEKDRDPKAEVEEDGEISATESGRISYSCELHWAHGAGDLATTKVEPRHVETTAPSITCVAQLSPLRDIASYPSMASINPLPMARPDYAMSETNSIKPCIGPDTDQILEGRDECTSKRYDVSDDGVTNQYFERVNSVERPNRLELTNCFSVDDSVVTFAKEEHRAIVEGQSAGNMPKPMLFEIPDKLALELVGETQQVRDDNIPGENRDDYKELLSMTIESRVTPLPLNMSSAARKRRDPRRKTLTRSSTIELEERFQAFEQRLSQEQTDKTENTKYIPTTAALEERFHTMEKQRSLEKQRLEEYSEPNSDCFEKPERIPSTAALELRFDALTKQISSTEPNSKAPLELGDQEQPSGSSSKKEKDGEKTCEMGETEKSKSDTKQIAIKSEQSQKEEAESQKEMEKPRLKKLPSTAELEDRFNALERKMSIQKSSPAKAKKEPPDGEAENENQRSTRNECEIPRTAENESDGTTAHAVQKGKEDANEKAGQNLQEERQDEKVEKVKPVEEKAVIPTEESKTTPKTEKPQPVKSNLSSNAEEKQEVEKVKRKPPPSTEELEKRFNDLERQRSTTNLESKDAAKQGSSSNAKEINETIIQSSESEKVPMTKIEQEEKILKSVKSFDDKVKAMSASLAEQESIKEFKVSEATTVKRLAFEAKCKTATSSLVTQELHTSTESNNKITANSELETESAAGQPELRQRRASEPPSTDDLEKRYERLKRRLSSKTNFANETVNEALERIEQEVIAEMSDKGDEGHKAPKKEPPTTEDLESRFEALHDKDKKDTEVCAKPKIASPPHSVDVAIEAHIPEPPPPPPVEQRIVIDPGKHQQRALIEELQSKMQGQSPGEENLRPSDINPQRKRQQQQRHLQQRPTPMGDETSETPASTAYYRSGNYEPRQEQRTVRRFSDLPSRADLENRLQFLEKKLYKRFYKQRCASDSEVASRTVSYDDKPSTSQQAEVHLEQRVLALEKQLSENSLRLLEAIRQKEKEKEKTPIIKEDSYSPRRLSTDTETGKELVRYTQNFSDLEESDKPINISINIKMMLNKESEHKKVQVEPTTDDLRRRLEQLEQQLIEERTRNGTIIPDCELSTDDELLLPPKQSEESEACKKQDKDTHNQSVKCDESEKVEDISLHAAESHKPETVKETKTLQNQEKAQSRNKEAEVENTTNDEKAIVDKTSKHEVTLERDNSPPTPKEGKVEKVDTPSTPKQEVTAEKTTSSKQINKVETTTALAADQNETPTTLDQVEHKNESAGKPEIVNNNNLTVESNIESKANEVLNACDVGSVDSNNKTVVLLMDNEPKALKVRRLTRANTEELEGLFQALEKQLNDRNLIKSKDGKLVRAETKPSTDQIEQAQAIADLSKEIKDFTSGKTEPEPEPEHKVEKTVEDEPNYDWGPNPVKHHLKRKTVYLPSTKELEARFRSLERQIKLLEDVEKIDVEHRLCEIERKIKLQYSLSHEKDLNKYLELCEGKGLDDEVPVTEETTTVVERSRSPARKQASKSPYISPSRKTPTKSPYVSPSRKSKSPYTSPTRQKTPHTSPSHTEVKKKSPYTSPARRQPHKDDLPVSDDLEYKYRVLDLVRSKSKDNLSKRKNDPNKKPPIHPLEMLLDSSPDDSEIPSTGQLEHRIRILDEKLKSPSRNKSRSRSPTIDDIKRKKMLDDQRPKTPVHSLERLVYSPTKPEPPTAEELDQRILALEKDHCFDYKTQKDYKEFNQKLKNVVSPSISYNDFKAAKSREQSPRRPTATTPKSAMRHDDNDDDRDYRREDTSTSYRPTSPKVIRFRDEDEDYFEEKWRPKSRQGQASERMNLADRSYSSIPAAGSTSEGLDELGCRLMRETSPITRTGTHTGVPLRTADNINERLSSIKNSIKSIDSLCEEKSYQKEKCQRYIDSLFSDSKHFASKKSSAEDLTHSRSESRGRGTQRCSDYTPAIRISSEHRSLGSVESLRIGSPLRGGVSPPHHRSHRDISRELSPSRRRRETEELEERESSRVRRDNMFSNYIVDNRSELSSCSSLTKFHKVDRQLEETCAKYADDRRSACKSPLSSPYESRTAGTRYNSNNTTTIHTATTGDNFTGPISPYRQPYNPNRSTRSTTPIYQPAKLEIRHTTVTSTFYDRFLTERQIEKQTLSRPPSRSPVVSPSATTKSYTDLPGTLTAHKYSRESMLDAVATTSSYSSPLSRSFAGSSSNYSYLSTHTTASEAPASIPSIAPQLNASPSGSASDLRLRSYENKLTASTSSTSSTSTAFIPSYSSANITASAFTPYNFTSSFTTTSVISNLSSDSHSYSTGVYNPMMSFTLREPSIGSTGSGLLGQYQYKSGLSTNYSSYSVKNETDKP